MTAFLATRITQAVRHGHEALLAPPGDAPALAGQLDRLLGDPALAARLAEGAMRAVRTRFGPEGVADRWAALYCELAHPPEARA